MKRLLVLTALTSFVAAPVLAGHNNPWAGPEDTIQEQFHDENQAQSANTPGDTEMRGAMVQGAYGKTGDTAGAGANGQKAGAGRGDNR